MDADVLENLADPAVLFFFLGAFIGLIRSNLEIPQAVAKFCSLYLLLALGFKGGQALAEAGVSGEGVKVVGAAVVLALVIPAVWFLVLRRRIDPFDAAAIAATYGSVSAVTFVTAAQFVADRGDAAGGHMTVALVLMESPAIVMAVLLATWVRSRAVATGRPAPDPAVGVGAAVPGLAVTDARTLVPEAAHPAGHRGPEETGHDHTGTPVSVREVLREAFTDGTNLLLVGAMVVGALSGEKGGAAMDPFVNGIFKGVLAFFLLEIGLLVARQLREARGVGPFLVGFGVVVPFLNAALALAIGAALGLTVGDLTLLTVLAASGSYIVVPAVLRYAIPEARPGRYLTLALGVTFPINITVGIPLYYAAASALAG